MKEIDPEIQLDDEQRRAVIVDDDHCLLVAGAGAGKTTTMAAKVKYLVEKKHVSPEEIIVISYTNKAIGELRERINQGLGIPAKICTFHAFAFDIVKQFSAEPPEVNFSSYKIISDMLERVIFHDKELMRKLVMFLGYYFDLTEDVFKFEDLNQYHIYKAAQDYETLKSGLGEYINKVERQRSKQVKTITGEYLRSVQEVQIANFLYLNGLDYEYEKPYPWGSLSTKKYTPDFYIVQGEHAVWLEHYALTEWYYSNVSDEHMTAMTIAAIRLHREQELIDALTEEQERIRAENGRSQRDRFCDILKGCLKRGVMPFSEDNRNYPYHEPEEPRTKEELWKELTAKNRKADLNDPDDRRKLYNHCCMFGTAKDAIELFESIQDVPMAESSYQDAIARYIYLGNRDKALHTAMKLATSRLWAAAGPTQVRPMSFFEDPNLRDFLLEPESLKCIREAAFIDNGTLIRK